MESRLQAVPIDCPFVDALRHQSRPTPDSPAMVVPCNTRAQCKCLALLLAYPELDLVSRCCDYYLHSVLLLLLMRPLSITSFYYPIPLGFRATKYDQGPGLSQSGIFPHELRYHVPIFISRPDNPTTAYV